MGPRVGVQASFTLVARAITAVVVLTCLTECGGQTYEQRLKSFGFIAQPGGGCLAPLLLARDGALYGTATGGGTNNGGVVFKVNRDGTGYVVLHNLGGGTDGQAPSAGLLQGADGALYGTTSRGGQYFYGTLFKFNPDGSGYTVLHSFPANVSDGSYPGGRLVQGADMMIYGVTSNGGAGGKGTVFRVRTNGFSYAVVRYFLPTGGDGQGPDGLALFNGTNLYGTTMQGGSNAVGTIYTMRTDGTQYSIVHHFANWAADGHKPNEPIIGNDGALYGTTQQGGSSASGVVFKYSTNGYTLLHQFGSVTGDGWQSMAGLLQGRDGALYGTTSSGGAFGYGSLFKLNTDASGYAVIYNSGSIWADAKNPNAGLAQDGNGTLYGTCPTSLFELNADGTGFTTLCALSPGGGDGQLPNDALAQSPDGILYGTTSAGGSGGRGAVFKLNSDGTGYSLLHNFGGATYKDGLSPSGTLLRVGGGLYGVTSIGGSNGMGIVFRMNLDGSGYSMLHTFIGSGAGDGQGPYGGLIQAADGMLYGTTYNGGTTNRGTIFSLSPDGVSYSVLHGFGVLAGDGQQPRGRLMQAGDGALYGTTYAGGSDGAGTVFRMTTDAVSYGVLHSFMTNGVDGLSPYAELVQGADAALYGTTYGGGAAGVGTIFKLNCDGTGYSVVHSFSTGNLDGQRPHGGLVQASDGALYGATYLGGTSGLGAVFRLDNGGTDYAVVYSFAASGGGGQRPYASLVQGVDGALYGTTSLGGDMNYGTVFRLPIPPYFVNMLQTSDNNIQLSLGVIPGANYLVEASSDLTNWTVLMSTSNQASPSVFSDLSATNFQRRFYRALYSR